MNGYITKICETGNIAVDDTILVKGVPATAGSKMLDGFKPLFSAEAVTRLETAGYTVSGKTATGVKFLSISTSFFSAAAAYSVSGYLVRISFK